MCTNVMDHPCELTTHGKLFFTPVLKTTREFRQFDHEESLYHVIFFFMCVVNEIPLNLQKIESAYGGKTRMSHICVLLSSPTLGYLFFERKAQRKS